MIAPQDLFSVVKRNVETISVKPRRPASSLVTCCRRCRSRGQTCTWAGSPEALPRTPAGPAPPSSSSSAEDTNRRQTASGSRTLRSRGLGVSGYLVFAPQEVVGPLVDAGADKVHPVVLNPEVEIPEPEHQPGPII